MHVAPFPITLSTFSEEIVYIHTHTSTKFCFKEYHTLSKEYCINGFYFSTYLSNKVHYYIFQTKFAHVEGLCKSIPLKETLRSLKGNAQNEITTCWKESRNLLKESHVVRKIEVHQEVQKTLFDSLRQFLTRVATNSRKQENYETPFQSIGRYW